MKQSATPQPTKIQSNADQPAVVNSEQPDLFGFNQSPQAATQLKLKQVSDSSRQVKQLQAYQQMANHYTGTVQRKVMPAVPVNMQTVVSPVVQRMPVIQLRAISTIEADLDALSVTIHALTDIDENSSVGVITTRQAALAAFPALIAPLAIEVAEKGGDAAPDLGALDSEVAAINIKEPKLTTAISSGQAPEPPKPVGAWGAGRGAHAVWKADNDKLQENIAERDTIRNRRTTLTAQRPVSVLKDKLSKIKTKLAALQANLQRAEQSCYFYLLLTTTAPAMTTHKYEGKWQNGESDLGIFIFRGTGPIQGIPESGVGPVEVHIHFSHGSKTINKAHTRGAWDGINLYPNGPGYAGTALAACKAAMP